VNSPIDTNSLAAALNAGPNAIGADANANRAEGVNAPSSPGLNIPNDEQNYHWFLSESTGSRTPISPSIGGVGGIEAAMGVDHIANRVLSHLAA